MCDFDVLVHTLALSNEPFYQMTEEAFFVIKWNFITKKFIICKYDYVLLFHYRSDSAYFDGLDETILCAGLVKAKPGLFNHWSKKNNAFILQKGMSGHINPLHPNLGMHFLQIVLPTFSNVLTRIINLTIKSAFSWWSFLLVLWP